jgi:hypothetical protein
MAAPFPAAPVLAEPAKTATRSLQTAVVSTAAIAGSWKNTVAAHVATSAVKNWMSAYVRTAKNASAVHMIVSAKTDLRSNSLLRATGTVALIYHNICCPHRLKGTQGVYAASCLFPAPFPVHIVKKRP